MPLVDQKLIKILLQKEDPLILEIGSHVGHDTKKFLEEFRDIRIFCFEPDPRCIKSFKNAIKDYRCQLIEAAVSNRNGTTTLYLSGGWPPNFSGEGVWDSSSSIKQPISNSESYPWLTFNQNVEVNTIKLDTWILENNINFIDFIWADVQGAEKDMIEGATATLQITKYLFTEYGEISPYPGALTRIETIELLKMHNFEIIPEYSDKGEIGNLLFENKFS